VSFDSKDIDMLLEKFESFLDGEINIRSFSKAPTKRREILNTYLDSKSKAKDRLKEFIRGRE